MNEDMKIRVETLQASFKTFKTRWSPMTSEPTGHPGDAAVEIHKACGFSLRKFQFETWMEPLAHIWLNHRYEWKEVKPSKAALEVKDACVSAYLSGYTGDFESVDAFVGGYELAHADDPKPYRRHFAAFSSLEEIQQLEQYAATKDGMLP